MIFFLSSLFFLSFREGFCFIWFRFFLNTGEDFLSYSFLVVLCALCVSAVKWFYSSREAEASSQASSALARSFFTFS
jgi:hypothetical protein